jgi:hypothetical protein
MQALADILKAKWNPKKTLGAQVRFALHLYLLIQDNQGSIPGIKEIRGEALYLNRTETPSFSKLSY